MLEIKEINELGNKLLSEDFNTSPIINSATYDLSQILVDKKFNSYSETSRFW